MNPKRRLVYRFHSLPYVTRLESVAEQKLAADEDQDLKEEKRQVRYSCHFPLAWGERGNSG